MPRAKKVTDSTKEAIGEPKKIVEQEVKQKAKPRPPKEEKKPNSVKALEAAQKIIERHPRQKGQVKVTEQDMLSFTKIRRAKTGRGQFHNVEDTCEITLKQDMKAIEAFATKFFRNPR